MKLLDNQKEAIRNLKLAIEECEAAGMPLVLNEGDYPGLLYLIEGHVETTDGPAVGFGFEGTNRELA